MDSTDTNLGNDTENQNNYTTEEEVDNVSESNNASKVGFYINKKDYDDYLMYNGGNIDKKDESTIINKIDNYLFSDKKKILCKKGIYVVGFENFNFLRLNGFFYLVEKNGNKITKLVDEPFKFTATKVTFKNKSFQGEGYIPLSNIDYLKKKKQIILN